MRAMIAISGVLGVIGGSLVIGALSMPGGAVPGVRYSSRFRARRYPPHAAATKELFREAAVRAGFPAEWGDMTGLHEILDKESGGHVGALNYTFEQDLGLNSYNAQDQGEAFRRMREGYRQGITGRALAGHIGVRSTATGLGQLLHTNAVEYYPDKMDGLGDPMNEAIGMLRYIRARYGDPETAWRFYQLPECEPGSREDDLSRYSTRAFQYGCKPGEGY